MFSGRYMYEAKNFIRDKLKAFNLLYGTAFVDASEYYWPKEGRRPLIDFAEATFGPDDERTKYLKQLSPCLQRVIGFRNAVEHPGGRSGTLHIRNFQMAANGKFDEPAWWLEKNGKNEPESSIRAGYVRRC